MNKWKNNIARKGGGEGVYTYVNEFILIEISENPIKITLNGRSIYKKEYDNLEDAKKAALHNLKKRLLDTIVAIEEDNK